MKQWLLLVAFSLLSVTPISAADDNNPPPGDKSSSAYVSAVFNLPGEIIRHLLTSYFDAVKGIVDSVGTAFGDAADAIEEKGNISKIGDQ
jgi:hypothetical protein